VCPDPSNSMSMPRTRVSPLTAVCLVREVLRLDGDPGPEVFLRAGSGGARGFWGRRPGNWVAWRGSLLTVGVEAGGLPSEDRFAEVARQAARVQLPEGEDPPRFHGGFSFRDDHSPEGVWSAFPAARFILPSLELERSDSGVVLVAQALAPEGGVEDEVRGGLRGRLEALRRDLEQGPAAGVAPSTNGTGVVRRPSDRESFEAGVRSILAGIRQGELRKAVLARILDLELPRALDPVEVLARLRAANPSAHLFLLEPEAGRVLLGAAPEVVASVRDGVMRCTAVAGSVGRGSDPEEDRRLGERLLASAKDREEQDLTLREMLEQLAPRSRGPVETDPAPSLLVLPRIQHLETRIRARVAPGETVLTLLKALHPTPAVCGLPRHRALEVLRRIEPFQRGWYAGPVGWFDGVGEGEFVPALRSAVGGGRKWRLFAGAGIVPGSEPALEWEETGMKMESALRALLGGSGP
jgi:isochorismate synthase